MLLTNGQEEVNNLKSQLQIQEEELAQVSNRLLEQDDPALPESEPIQDLEADPIVDQQISQLKLKVQRMEQENRALRDKIENTNSGISSYISEMSTMLDSQELSNAPRGAQPMVDRDQD